MAASEPTRNSQIYNEVLKVHHKAIYIDVGSNERGTYVRISETSRNRQRSMVVAPEDSLPWFIALMEFYLDLPAEQRVDAHKELRVGQKVFYFSVTESEGRSFLRIAESGGPRGRSSVLLTTDNEGLATWTLFLQKLVDAHNALCARIERTENVQQDISEAKAAVQASGVVVGPAQVAYSVQTTPEGALVITASNKRFFFDTGSNHRGQFLKISEMLGMDKSTRNSIIVPVSALPLFRNALDESMTRLLQQGEAQ